MEIGFQMKIYPDLRSARKIGCENLQKFLRSCANIAGVLTVFFVEFVLMGIF